ncbi:hypothetical protein PAMC26577_01855 [Caballeronia sordidicola]|uniref:Uncharacterized protein n=1 Tax=Caballeronia sordidicola TaxID=196367 RepID=A0A242N899_CABSO|nr:hypothetical protein PAMC26577_01855 [Caballeronia sordidicola]
MRLDCRAACGHTVAARAGGIGRGQRITARQAIVGRVCVGHGRVASEDKSKSLETDINGLRRTANVRLKQDQCRVCSGAHTARRRASRRKGHARTGSLM